MKSKSKKGTASKTWGTIKSFCNQCGKQMGKVVFEVSYDYLSIAVCQNPKCPNYALLQISAEDMLNAKE